jgi:D-alanyl-lipoteichoic acid acyltransferase DltB (MBOAT superfamily)
MLFNSFSFLAFFTAVVIVYYTVPHRWRWALLLAASTYFYAALNPRYPLLLFGVALVVYGAGLALERASGAKRQLILAVGVVVPLSMLFLFKYYDFFVRSVEAVAASYRPAGAAPLFPPLGIVVAAGLSFYTFSCISYLVDVYAGRLPAERHAGRFALYIAFFPKLLAGPIERAKPFLSQLSERVVFDGDRISLGLQLMLWGLVKKVVIADRLATFVDAAYGQPAFSSPADLVIATYFFAFQLYCDFSGYTDIAIGAAKVLGFDLMENFRRPYLSTSVREFWNQRWHLSLSSWFRDYMYIPLGGSRCSRLRMLVNVTAVFLASGLWHGANWTFVIWGGLNGLYLVSSVMTAGLRERVLARIRPPRVLRRLLSGVFTFHLILVTWVFFRASSLSDAATVLSRIGGSLSSLPVLLQDRLGEWEVISAVTLVVVLLVVEVLDEGRSFLERVRAQPLFMRWAVYYALLLALVVMGRWDFQQFVYMQF